MVVLAHTLKTILFPSLRPDQSRALIQGENAAQLEYRLEPR
jgi:hypothetical protein